MESKDLLTIQLPTPAEWYRELYKLLDAGFTAAIAGGCLRDLDNGAQIKDVDIFVNPEPTGLLGEILGTNQARFRNYAIALGWAENQATTYGSIEDLHGIWTFAKDGVEFNVMLLRKPLSLAALAQRMDFGICQIVSNTCGIAWHTDAYAKDRANKTFTITDESREERSVARYARLQSKYAGWRLAL